MEGGFADSVAPQSHLQWTRCGKNCLMRKLTVLLALLIATATVTPSLAYYHHHRHSWGGGCVTGAYWRWAPHHGYSGWGRRAAADTSSLNMKVKV